MKTRFLNFKKRFKRALLRRLAERLPNSIFERKWLAQMTSTHHNAFDVGLRFFVVSDPLACDLGELICQKLIDRSNLVFGLFNRLSPDLRSTFGRRALRISTLETAATLQTKRCHAPIVFDTETLEKHLDAGTLTPNLPIVVCLQAEESCLSHMSQIFRAHPGYRFFIFVYALEDQRATSIDIDVTWIEISPQTSSSQAASLIASRIEQAIGQDLPDDVLQLSHSLSPIGNYARTASIIENHLPGSNEVELVIPTLNAGFEFRNTLESIRNQRLYHNCKITIVDSGSTDNTLALASEFGATVLSIEKKHFNHGLTRDFAVSKTDSNFVVLMVQDAVLMDSETLANLLRHFGTPSVAGVYTCSLPQPTHDLFAASEPLLHRHHLGPRAKFFSISHPEHFETLPFTARLQFCRFDNVTSVIRKSVWEQIPFGKCAFGEDMAWAKRVQLSGHTIAYDPFARVVHSHMRPSSYTQKRGVVQSVGTSEIFNGVANNYATLTYDDLLICEHALESQRQLIESHLVEISHGPWVEVEKLNIYVGRLQDKWQRDCFRLPNSMQAVPQRFLSLFQTMLSRAGQRQLEINEVLTLLEKVFAAALGDVRGDFASSYQLAGQKIPQALHATIEEARQSV